MLSRFYTGEYNLGNMYVGNPYCESQYILIFS